MISIIALLLSILMPTLSKVKEQARRVVCQAHLGQISLGIHMYANENRQKLPVTDLKGGAGWFNNVPYNVAEMIRKEYGLETLYCPANRLSRKGNLKDRYLMTTMLDSMGSPATDYDDIAGGVMVSDYLWLIEFAVSWRDPTDPSAATWVYPDESRFAGKRYFSSKLDVHSPASTCLVADGSFTGDELSPNMTVGDLDFSAIFWNGYDFITNHVRGQQVLGENSLYADSHIEWVPAKEMDLNFPLTYFNHWW